MTTMPSGPYEPYVPRLLLDWSDSIRHRQVEGSLVHVDISGFTALSERLARRGRIGAEEVSAILNSVFTDLLTIAAEQGGDLLKFGGDALLLLFTDQGHALRAVRAAALMRSRLRSIGKVQTPAGRVVLRMTVGVHSGTHDAFLVGSTHRELLILGPGATKTVEVEEAADAGDILLSQATAAQVPQGLLGEERAAGVLLKRTPPPVEYEPPLVMCQEECSAFIPTALRPVVAAPIEGEHRRTTVGFIKFVGTDRMLAEHGPEWLADHLEEMVTVVQRAASEFGVTFLSSDLDADGGKIILAGGVPTATGADEERVLRALRRITDDYHEIALRIGVNHGAAFAGDIGAPSRRTYTIIGDAVNLAARVMGKANKGEILATESVLERSATRFALEEIAPFAVKGKTDLITAWKVGAIEGRKPVEADRDAPLFGRDVELAFIEPYLHGEHSVGLIDVSGPPGIGKSRLVRELRARNPHYVWHFGDCDQYEATTPYYVFRRLLREVAGVGRDASPAKAARRVRVNVAAWVPELLPWLPLLATAMGLPAEETPESAQLDPDFRQARIQQSVAQFLDAMSNQRSALIIEDAQWIDQESRDLMLYLAGRARGHDWGLIAVHRPLDEQFAEDDLVRLDLMPLDDEGARALAEHLLGDTPVLEYQLEDLIERADGNPLFLAELVSAARKGEVLPDNVEALVQARIDRLDREKRQLLRYSSVAGMRFAPGLLVEALREDIPTVASEHAWAGLDEFLVAQQSGDLRFRQTLFHDVAYSGISFRVRRRLHGEIGRVLERTTERPGELAEVMSLHFLLAGEYAKAWKYSLSAGSQAREKHSNVAATRFYERALEAARNVDLESIEIARVAEALGDVAEPAGLQEEADRALRRAARLRGDDAAGRARIYRKLGLLRERGGKYPQALRWFTRGLHLIERAHTDRARLQRAELQLAYAGVRFRQAKYRDAAAWAERAIELAERIDEPQAAAHGYYLTALARMRSGETQRQGHTERALAIYQELGNLVGQSNVLNKLGVDAYHDGDWIAAREYYRKSRESRQKAGDSVRAAMITQNEALVLSDQGHLDEAEHLFRQALREFQAADDHMAIGVVTSNLGRILTRRKQFAEGRELLEDALSELRAIGAEQFVIDAEIRIAENLVLSGDIDRGEEIMEDVATRLRSATDERHCLLHRCPGICPARQAPHR